LVQGAILPAIRLPKIPANSLHSSFFPSAAGFCLSLHCWNTGSYGDV
jgi:hypothetical protein